MMNHTLNRQQSVLQYRAIFFFVSVAFIAKCSVPGPVLDTRIKASTAKQKTAIDLPLIGTTTGVATWSAQAALSGWSNVQISELVMMRNSPFRDEATFELRIVSLNRLEALKLKTYQGVIQKSGESLELFTKHCRIYSKQKFDDRFVPVESWSCDHLLFVLKQNSDFSLQRIKDNDDDLKATDWLYLDQFKPLSLYPQRKGQPMPIWAGQRLVDVATNNNTAVFFGYDANRHLRSGDKLNLMQNDTLLPQIPATSVIGDFVSIDADSIGSNAKEAVITSHTTRQPKGMFD